jgi:hypothetical protein
MLTNVAANGGRNEADLDSSNVFWKRRLAKASLDARQQRPRTYSLDEGDLNATCLSKVSHGT